jgi:Fe-S oxidoreductase
LAISGQLQPPGLANPELHQSLDLCLACKACKSECPNAVDMAKLKSEALQAKWDREGIAAAAKFLGRAPQNIARLGRWGGPLRHLSHFSWAKRWLQSRYQIDARRSLPIPQSSSFDRWWQGQSHQLKLDWRQLVRRLGQQAAPPDKRANDPADDRATPIRRPEPLQVALFVDTWHRYLEPHIPQQIVNLLWSLNVAVVVPPFFDALRSRLSWGLLRESKAMGEPLLAGLVPLAAADIPLLMIEPSEASALIDDLPDLVSNREQAQRVANQVQMVDAYVAQLIAAEQIVLEPKLTDLPAAVKIHPHCHHRALFETESTRAILQAAGYNASVSNWGCCGMAGSFGYTHYDLSMQIAELRFAPMIRQADGQSEIVVTTGTSCRHQALDTTSIKTYHWAELVKARES